MTFFTYDEDPGDPAREVLEAAAVLDVCEFRIFELAYARWHGAEGTEKDVERHYLGYMFHDRVPAWVRHFCREVLDAASRDRFDPGVFGVPLAPIDPDAQRRGTRQTLLVLAVATTIHLIGMVITSGG